MQPARASAVAAVVFATVGLLGGAAALTYAHVDASQDTTVDAASHGHGQAHARGHSQDHADKKADKKGDDASAAGRAHAEAMRAWARCVAAAASGPKAENAPVPLKTSCGDKPAPPGWVKHGRDGSPGNGGHALKPKADGHAESPED